MRPILSLTLLTAFAPLLTTVPAQARPYPRTVNQRQHLQQERIYRGVAAGQISPAEFRNLERRSLAIELQQRRDRRDGGGITPYERYRLNRRLNNVSESIYQNRRN